MIHSFLLIGQSNMAGRGFIEEAKPIDASHIKILRNGLWVSMFRPVNPDRSFSGVCLAESFAERYAKAHGVDVGLICCADGGTRLEQWAPGSILFDNAVNNARLAQRSSQLAGVLWHQGEGDLAEGRYLTYQPRFEVMLRALRAELGIADLPVVLGGLGDFLTACKLGTPENFKNYIHVNEALKSIAKDNEMTAFVSAEGLTANPDNLHFNAASLHEFGLRYFDAYEKLCSQKETLCGNGIVADTERTALELL